MPEVEPVWSVWPNDDRYEASSSGLVRRIGGQPRKPSINPKNGYHTVVFSLPGGRYYAQYVHRIVMETFVGPCPAGKEVSHQDGDKANNRLSNLAYETKKENQAKRVIHGTDFRGTRNPGAKLTEAQIREIVTSDEASKALAERFGVSRTSITRTKAAHKHPMLDTVGGTP